MTSKHFDYNDRCTILLGIKSCKSVRAIAHSLDCSPSSVSRELQRNRVLDEPSYYHSKMTECLRGFVTDVSISGPVKKLKYRYDPSIAQQAYEKSPHESRRKIRTGSSELAHIDLIITPLIRDNGQSVAHVFHSHSESLGISRSTLYQYIDDNRLTVRNIDFPARVRYPKHTKTRRGDNSFIYSQKYRENHDYTAFQAYLEKNPKVSVVEMDTVEGIKGKIYKVLLTLNHIQKAIRFGAYATILTDNKSEFKNAEAIEKCESHRINRSYVFYCDFQSFPAERAY